MSLLGLVRHMAEVERGWFRRRMAGLDTPHRLQLADPVRTATGTARSPTRPWSPRPGSAGARSARSPTGSCADAPDLDVVGGRTTTGPISLRELLVHMIEEYARHNGHADLLRRTDRRRGPASDPRSRQRWLVTGRRGRAGRARGRARRGVPPAARRPTQPGRAARAPSCSAARRAGGGSRPPGATSRPSGSPARPAASRPPQRAPRQRRRHAHPHVVHRRGGPRAMTTPPRTTPRHRAGAPAGRPRRARTFRWKAARLDPPACSTAR